MLIILFTFALMSFLAIIGIGGSIAIIYFLIKLIKKYLNSEQTDKVDNKQ